MARHHSTTRRASARARTGALAAALALTLGAGTAVASDTLPWPGESAVGANQPYQHGYSSTDLLRWTRAHRCPDGAYLTGLVYPRQVAFPDGERTAYTGAAILLAADALSGATPGSRLFEPDAALADEPGD